MKEQILPDEMTVAQAKVNLLAERLQELYESGLDRDQIEEAATHFRDELFGAIDEKIDAEIKMKGKAVIFKHVK